jgi:hypothetical protein
MRCLALQITKQNVCWRHLYPTINLATTQQNMLWVSSLRTNGWREKMIWLQSNIIALLVFALHSLALYHWNLCILLLKIDKLHPSIRRGKHFCRSNSLVATRMAHILRGASRSQKCNPIWGRTCYFGIKTRVSSLAAPCEDGSNLPSAS